MMGDAMSTYRNPPMKEKSDEKIEQERLEALEEAQKHHGEGLEGFSPGSYGCHEAFHTSHVCYEAVIRELLVHPAIIRDPLWYRLTSRASDTLYELYQQMGAGHLSLTGKPPEPKS